MWKDAGAAEVVERLVIGEKVLFVKGIFGEVARSFNDKVVSGGFDQGDLGVIPSVMCRDISKPSLFLEEIVNLGHPVPNGFGY